MSDENTIEFQPGDTIFNEKDPGGCLYVIKEGQVGVFKKGQSELLPLAIVGSGEFLGEMSLIREKQRSSTAIALTPVKVIKMTKGAFKVQLDKTPKWVRALLDGLVQRLDKMDELVKRNGVKDEQISQTIENIAKKNGISLDKKPKPSEESNDEDAA